MALAGAVRGNGERHDLYPLIHQFFDLVARSSAADPALRAFAIVDLAGFLGKSRTYIFGMVDDLLDQLDQQVLADVGVLLPGLAARCRPRIGGASDVRSMRDLHHIPIAAQRANDEPAFQLLLEFLARGEPALEAMVVLTAQIENDHWSLPTKPPAGTTILDRCC